MRTCGFCLKDYHHECLESLTLEIDEGAFNQLRPPAPQFDILCLWNPTELRSAGHSRCCLRPPLEGWSMEEATATMRASSAQSGTRTCAKTNG